MKCLLYVEKEDELKPDEQQQDDEEGDDDDEEEVEDFLKNYSFNFC